MRVLVGVSGGIAAYKAVLVVRSLVERGHDVQVVPTPASLSFVGRATWEALSGHPAGSDLFEDVDQVRHVRLGQWADVMVVVPATADLLARACAGRSDDLLTASLLMASGPVLLVPAMHSEMWQHPATQNNVAMLRERGVQVMPPADGRLTGADSGPGRLPEPSEVVAAIERLDPTVARPWQGQHVVVSAGGTREPLDPVRYLGNRSSGKQGVAIARAAASRGARVTLVAANVAVPVPDGIEVVRVGTALELGDQVRAAAQDADVVVMAAAVADFRPASSERHKIKKVPGGPPPVVELVENPDILAGLVEDPPRPGQLVVGFAAETGDGGASVLDHARAKARRKGAHVLVVNDVTGGEVFAADGNAVVFIDSDGEALGRAAGSKADVAVALCELLGSFA